MPSSRGSSQPRDQTWVSCIAGRLFITWATREGIGRKNIKNAEGPVTSWGPGQRWPGFHSDLSLLHPAQPQDFQRPRQVLVNILFWTLAQRDEQRGVRSLVLALVPFCHLTRSVSLPFLGLSFIICKMGSWAGGLWTSMSVWTTWAYQEAGSSGLGWGLTNALVPMRGPHLERLSHSLLCLSWDPHPQWSTHT